MIDKINIDKTNAWPFVEAKKIIRERKKNIESKGKITLQTGYGPSGLPHIGTFGEVVRTSMVKNAFSSIIDCPTKLITFSDDMDGLRKVPENVPNKEMLEKFIGKPLTSIPDPFGKFESFGHHNNAKLRSFLDEFNFDYEFMSASEQYLSGRFDETLIDILNNYIIVCKISSTNTCGWKQAPGAKQGLVIVKFKRYIKHVTALWTLTCKRNLL